MATPRGMSQDLVHLGLLERLTDDFPQETVDTVSSRTFSLTRLREAILRDLSWLLNTSQLATSVDLTPYPDVAISTLNYGVRSRTGREVESLDPSVLRREILQSLRRFEPRLLPGSLEVTVIEAARDGTFQFGIVADLWAQPQPVRMRMRTEIGETAGSVRVVEIQGLQS